MPKKNVLLLRSTKINIESLNGGPRLRDEYHFDQFESYEYLGKSETDIEFFFNQLEKCVRETSAEILILHIGGAFGTYPLIICKSLAKLNSVFPALRIGCERDKTFVRLNIQEMAVDPKEKKEILEAFESIRIEESDEIRKLCEYLC